MRKFILLTTGLLMLLLANHAMAAIQAWDPNGTTSIGGNSTWDTSSLRWTPAGTQTQVASGSLVAWSGGNAALFSAGPSSGSSQGSFTVTVNTANISIGGIYNGALNPGSDVLTLTGTGSLSLASGQDAFDTAGTVAGTTTINVPLNGSGTLLQQGSGALVLGAANTYSGGTLITGTGGISFGNNTAFGTGTVIWEIGGFIQPTSGSTAFTVTNLMTHITNGFETYAGSTGGVTFSNWNLAPSGTLVVENIQGAITVAGAITGASALVISNKPGTTWTFSGVNTYSGATWVTNGATLTIGGAGQLGSGGTYSATITNGGTFNYSSSANQTFSGAIWGSGGTFNVTSGNLTLSGTSDNNSLGVNVSGGTLILGKASTGGVHSLGGTTTVNSGGTLQLGGSGNDQLFDGVTFTVNSGGVFDMNGKNEGVTGGISLAGTGISSGGAMINSASSTTSFWSNAIALTASSSLGGAGNLTVAGVISGSPFALTKVGAGTLKLNSVGTYSGGTTISAGTFQQGVNNALPAGAITLANGATLDLNSFNDSIASLDVSPGATLPAGNVNNNNGTLTIISSTNQNSGEAGVSAYSGVIGGSGNLIISGGATTLSGTNTYGGATTVSSGVLVPSFNGAIPSGSAVTVNGSGVLDLASVNETISSLAGSGTVDLESGTLTTGGGTTFSGVIQNAPLTYTNVTSGNGLQGFYFTNQFITNVFSQLKVIRTDAQVNFSDFTQSSQNPLAPGQTTNFCIRWVGQVLTTTNGTYSFTTTSDDGSRLWVNGQLVVDNWAFQGATSRSGTIALAANTKYDIRLEYIQGGGGASCVLSWIPPSGVSNVIPNANLFTYPGAGGLTKTGANTLTLSGVNTYTGATTINAGTLALASSGSINNSASLSIAAGATFDVSAISSYALSASTTLSASGTGTTVGSTAAAIKGGTTVSLGSQPISLTFTPTSFSGDTTHPSLYISQGTLSLNGNTFTVNNASGTALNAGAYRLVQQARGSITSSGSYSVSVTGSGLVSGATASIQVSGGNVNLVVLGTPTFSGLTASQSITYGTTSVTLSGKVSATGPIYPASGETISVSINGNAQTTMINDSTGDFSINYNNSGILYSPNAYTITYSYAGDASLAAASDTSKTLTINPPTAPAITTSPLPQTACSSGSATFSVAASGTADSYAWYKHSNAGWGSAWTVGSSSGGTYLGSSANNNAGAQNCNTFSSHGDINTPGGNSWGLYGGSGGAGESVARTFPASLTSGQVFQIDMDNGGVDSGKQNGFSLQTSSGTFLLSFYFLGGGSDYVYYDTSTHTTSVGFTRTGLRIQVIVGSGSPAAYSLLITACGGSTVSYTGTFAAAGTPGKVVVYNNNTSTGSDNDLFFNSMFAGAAYDDADNYSGNWPGSDNGDASPISGATTSSYTTSTGSNGDLYYAIAYNGAGFAASSTAQLTIEPAGTASTGGNQTICAGSSTAGLGGSIGGGATGGTWSTSGTGTFSPNTSTLNATYNPSAADITAGTVTLTLSTTGQTSPCGPATAQVVVTINPAATASTGGNQTICPGSSTAALGGSVGGGATGGTWTTSGTGTFSPSTTNLNATYLPSGADITSGSVTLTLTTTGQLSPCGAATAQVIVTFYSPATAGAGGNQTICSSSSTAGLGGSVGGSATGGVWSTFGTGTFSPSATTLNATYVPSGADITAGSVTLTLTTTGQPCSAATAHVVVTINPAATASAGGNQTICSGSSTTGLGGSVGGGATGGTWSTSGTGTFSPSTTNLNATYVPSGADIANGSVTLTLTTSGQLSPCGAATAQVIVTINSAATASTGGNQTICSGNSTAALGGSVGGGATGGYWSTSGTGTFSPNTNTLNATYTPSAADITNGSVTLTLTTSGQLSPCGAATAQVVVTINPTPTITLGSSPVLIYYSASNATLPYSATTGSPNTYSITYDATAHGAGFVDVPWTNLPSSPIPLVIPIAAGTNVYNGNLTVSNSSGCSSSSAAFTVTITNALSTNALTSSANPAGPGTNVSFTATLTAQAPSTGVPTGTVQFLIDGAAFGSPVTLDTNGVATSITTNSLSHGYHTNEADYAGDANFLGSTNTLIELINTPPVAGPATYSRPRDISLMIAISDLLTNASDADGDTITLTAVSTNSTNGASIYTNATYVFYSPPATNGNVTDAFSYTVSDTFGATSSNTVTVTIQADYNGPSVNITGITTNGNGTVTIDFAGIPNLNYLIQASTNLSTSPIVWTTLSTNMAGTNGLFNYTDTDASNYSTRYYRTSIPTNN